MKYINTFKTHASYEEKFNGVGGVDIILPNVSYCEDVKDVHYNPYNTVEFYVGNITDPWTVSIYTDSSTSVDIQVSEGNKWYTYLLPKDKELYRISGYPIKKVVVKADISFEGTSSYPYEIIIPNSVVEASFKGSNTSNVTNMNHMFSNCSGLTSLDLRNFDTSNVTDMGNMFYGCSGLTSLYLRNFNTSNVTDMNNMFKGCSGLTSLDLRNFNTSNVTNMSGMFSDCTNITSLYVSSFDTSKVEAMSNMFSNCSNITSLDLSGWDTSNVTGMYSMYAMFKGCTSLTSIRMVGCEKPTIDKIKAQLKKDNITGVTIVTE